LKYARTHTHAHTHTHTQTNTRTHTHTHTQTTQDGARQRDSTNHQLKYTRTYTHAHTQTHTHTHTLSHTNHTGRNQTEGLDQSSIEVPSEWIGTEMYETKTTEIYNKVRTCTEEALEIELRPVLQWLASTIAGVVCVCVCV